VIRLLFCILGWTVLSIPAAVLGFPALYLTGRVDLLWNLSLWAASTGCRLAGIRVHSIGHEQLETGRAYLFMSNHTSNLDPPVIAPLLGQRISIITKMELFKIPVFGRAMRAAGFVAVDRADRKAAIQSVRDAVRVLHSGLGMLVFPEGTRSTDGKLLPFKKGPFSLAIEAGVPVVPITIVGSHEAWPKGKFCLRPREVTVIFHSPIDPHLFARKQDLLPAVRAAIHNGLPEEYRDDVNVEPASH